VRFHDLPKSSREWRGVIRPILGAAFFFSPMKRVAMISCTFHIGPMESLEGGGRLIIDGKGPACVTTRESSCALRIIIRWLFD
jgi:hypothetical protein